jgi:hypothetical protein
MDGRSDRRRAVTVRHGYDKSSSLTEQTAKGPIFYTPLPL